MHFCVARALFPSSLRLFRGSSRQGYRKPPGFSTYPPALRSDRRNCPGCESSKRTPDGGRQGISCNVNTSLHLPCPRGSAARVCAEPSQRVRRGRALGAPRWEGCPPPAAPAVASPVPRPGSALRQCLRRPPLRGSLSDIVPLPRAALAVREEITPGCARP